MSLLLLLNPNMLSIDVISVKFPFSSLPIPNGIGLIGAIVLVCFISILVLIITLLASMSDVDTEPTSVTTYREKEAEKDNDQSDIVWTNLTTDRRKFIFDQDNPNGLTVIGMLGRATTTIETHTINGVQYTGILHDYNIRENLPRDELRRAYNRAFFFSRVTVNITSRREPLRFDSHSVILKRFNQ